MPGCPGDTHTHRLPTGTEAQLAKMAENLQKVPKRGILKQSTSFEQRGEEKASCTKEPHFDESNILATLHPADKDYGFMKIDEPKTPYEAYESDGDDQKEELDASLLAARIAAEGHKGPRPRRISEPSADLEDISLLSPEEREKRRMFETKRKKHYNEFQAVKMARALMDEDDSEEDEKPAEGAQAGTPDGAPVAAAGVTMEGSGSTGSTPMETGQ